MAQYSKKNENIIPSFPKPGVQVGRNRFSTWHATAVEVGVEVRIVVGIVVGDVEGVEVGIVVGVVGVVVGAVF